MKVEILYFEGCPTYERTERILREVLAEFGTEAELELVAVDSDEEAQRLRFLGSPTLRVDGEDLFPGPDRAVYALVCRMYATPEGLKGSPTAEMLKEALSNFLELRKAEVQLRRTHQRRSSQNPTSTHLGE
jgi:hypothetical protein